MRWLLRKLPRRAVERLRRSPLLRTLTGRAPLAGGDRVRRGLPPITGAESSDPVAMIVLMRADPQMLDAWAAAAQTLIECGNRFAPLFVVDAADFRAVTARGFLAEYVPTEGHWRALGLDAEQAAARRDDALRVLVTEYRPDTIVRVPAGDRSTPGDTIRSCLEATSA